MADDENQETVTPKEKEASKEPEKDTDTSSQKSSRLSIPNKSPSASKSKSRSGSALSGGSAKNRSSRTGSPTSAKSSAKSRRSKPQTPVKKSTDEEESEKDNKTPIPVLNTEGPLPENCVPLFLSGQSQGIFNCVADEQVTAENPYKLISKESIIQDFKNRAAVCDFHPVKQVVFDYPGDEILVVYDCDFVWGQNFFVALTEEAKELLLRPPKPEGEEGEEGTAEQDAEPVIYKYIPPEPKDWISFGSEIEIEEESVREHRNQLQVVVRRVRREFGAPCTFTDRNVGDAKDGYIECTPYEDKSYDLNTIELDKGTQAIPFLVETSTQTDWKYPRNACTQYYPREFTDEEKEAHLNSKNLKDAVNNVTPRFKLSLQQNEIMDVFIDDWYNLSDMDSTFGSKADNHLKEYQSFTDLQFSKEKTITCIDWHPTIRGVIAVSVAERIAFDDRIDQSARIIMTPSLILIWSFTDPIHPQLLLEAPDDIYGFKFCPTDPNIIVGGCMNGQVVLWDISAHVERLKVPRSTNKKKNPMDTLKGFEDENALETPIVRYAAVSSIEHSHKAAITDILWVPDHMEVTRMGIPIENKSQQCTQIMTCATDHTVLFWDIKPPKSGNVPESKMKTPMGVPTTFKHLDLTWKPVLKVTLLKSEPGGDHSPIKFSISEKQGNRSVLSNLVEKKEVDATQSQSGGFSFGSTKPGSAKAKTLENVNTHFYVGTEDGEIVYVDWMPQKDQDTGKIGTMKPIFYNSFHDGPVVAMQRSPFFSDVILLVGGWTFSIWKEKVNSGPILSSCAATKRLTYGHWSPSRPSVFYITRADGSVDVWDLLDKTHEPSLNQSVSSHAITCIFPYEVTAKQHLLAVGDDAGTLHIMEIPWSLRHSVANEEQMMLNYVDREVKRRHFVEARWDFREQEKREMEAETKKKAGIAPNVVLTEEEILYKMKQEYQAYLDDESSFLRELGLKDDIDEPLPEV
ncbi:dynein axonemal intermediate chain 3-like [Tubulanus polymorphus]|uniref:dynein axonemal intermediate chain 3-like n=1 Tax=Tubulanus polymorphus TaxID=672921 RepID=UPI003DA662BA